MLNNLCIDNKVQMHFNLKRAFKKFAQEANRPSDAAIPVEEAREEGATGRGDQPLGIEEQLNVIRVEKQKSQKMQVDAKLSSQWKYLYNNVAPIILQACIINDHYDKFV